MVLAPSQTPKCLGTAPASQRHCLLIVFCLGPAQPRSPALAHLCWLQSLEKVLFQEACNHAPPPCLDLFLGLQLPDLLQGHWQCGTGCCGTPEPLLKALSVSLISSCGGGTAAQIKRANILLPYPLLKLCQISPTCSQYKGGPCLTF